MKRIFILTICITVSFGLFAQKAKKFSNKASLYLSSGDMERTKESLDSAFKYPESNTLAQLLVVAGDYYLKLSETSKKSDDLFKSWDYYAQALKVDTLNKIDKEIMNKIILFQIPNKFFTVANNGFSENNFSKALTALEYVLDISNFENKIDTNAYYYSGLAAYYIKDYNKSIEYLSKTKNLKSFGYNSYINIKNSYLFKNDTSSAIKTLKESFVKYPDSTHLFREIVYFYALTNNSTEGLKFIDEQKTKSKPTGFMYFVEGTLYEGVSNIEKAKESYTKCINIEPMNFDCNYNIGVIYFNNAGEIVNKANELPTKEVEKFKIETAKGKEEFKRALPFLEKALEINPQSRNTVYSLKEIYYRLDEKVKYEEMKKKLESL